MTDWVRFARWSLGEITNDEYADALVAEGEDEDSPSIKVLRRPPQLAEPCVFCGEPVYGAAPYGPPYDDDGYRHDRCSEAHYRPLST